MNRFYYINEIYNSIMEWRTPKKIPTKNLVEKDLKKHIEEWLMYTFHVYYNGGEKITEDSLSTGVFSWKPTLRNAYDLFYDHLKDLRDQGRMNELYENKDVKKWVKKNRKLLKLQ